MPVLGQHPNTTFGLAGRHLDQYERSEAVWLSRSAGLFGVVHLECEGEAIVGSPHVAAGLHSLEVG